MNTKTLIGAVVLLMAAGVSAQDLSNEKPVPMKDRIAAVSTNAAASFVLPSGATAYQSQTKYAWRFWHDGKALKIPPLWLEGTSTRKDYKIVEAPTFAACTNTIVSLRLIVSKAQWDAIKLDLPVPTAAAVIGVGP